MAIPTKKIYGKNGKVIFDPSNPEDVRSYKEKQSLMEALKLVQGLADPRGGAGLTGMTRVISKAFGAKAAKALFKQNKAKQIADLVTKPMTKGKKAVPKATLTVKEIVETKPTIPTSGSTVSDKIKSLSNAEIKVFENVKNVRELAEKQAKNASTTTIPKSIRDSWEYNNAGREYYIDGVEGFRKAGTKAKSILSKLKDSTTKEAYEKSKATMIKQGIEEINRKIVDKAISIGAISGLIGGGTAATYYGMQQPTKNNKQTKTPQKTGPVDLKRIDESKLKPSSIPGVSITKAMVNGKEKEFGIVWDNKTQSWDYYRGNKTTENKQQGESGLAIGGGDSKRNDSSGTGSGGKTTTGGGTGTKPRSATGQAFDKAFAEARKQAGGAGGIFEFNNKKYGTALEGEIVPKNRVEVGKTTAPIIGDEEYKKDPRLAILIQEDDDRQLLARFKPTESLDVLPMPTKPLSSLMFKTSILNPKTNSRVEPVSYDTIDTVDTKSKKLRKKNYGGNLAMLKYMKQ